jgi:hypothetical protein
LEACRCGVSRQSGEARCRCAGHAREPQVDAGIQSALEKAFDQLELWLVSYRIEID